MIFEMDSPVLLAEEFRRLIDNRDFVKNASKFKKVNSVVPEWLDEVEKLIKEMNLEKERVGCNIAENPKWMRKMRRLEEKRIIKPFYITSRVSPVKSLSSATLKTILARGVPDPFAQCSSQQLEAQEKPDTRDDGMLQSFPSGNFAYYFASTKKASQELLQALQDDKCCVIGLYGKRGSGKTALLKAERVKHERIFRRVLSPVVSECQDIESIQEQMANLLRLDFDGDVGRVAGRISSELKRMDGTLVVLDDFPTQFTPQDIGIPCDSKRCKVLLTTRLKTYCISMGCHHLIPLEPLSNEEAWILLQQISDVDSQRDLLYTAKKVAFNCSGLPGLIKDVVSSLKNKTNKEYWKKAFASLTHSTARYQIFLSFRGPDTREVFTKPLYRALCQEGFRTFMDQETLQGGAQISKLLNDIEESRFSVVILSQKYADSEWCLKELAKILECAKKKGQLVLPIFYEVPPTDLRNLKNNYGKAIDKHAAKHGGLSETVQNWKSALYDVSYFTGIEKFSTGSVAECIQKIVKFANNERYCLHIQSMFMD